MNALLWVSAGTVWDMPSLPRVTEWPETAAWLWAHSNQVLQSQGTRSSSSLSAILSRSQLVPGHGAHSRGKGRGKGAAILTGTGWTQTFAQYWDQSTSLPGAAFCVPLDERTDRKSRSRGQRKTKLWLISHSPWRSRMCSHSPDHRAVQKQTAWIIVSLS